MDTVGAPVLAIDLSPAVAVALHEITQSLQGQLRVETLEVARREAVSYQVCGVVVGVQTRAAEHLHFLGWLADRYDALPRMIHTPRTRASVAHRACELGAWYISGDSPPRILLHQFASSAMGAGTSGSFAGLAADLFARRHRLSPKQREVVAAAVLDDRRDYVAAQCGISVSTVRAHIAAILDKTGCDDLRHIAALARLESGQKKSDT